MKHSLCVSAAEKTETSARWTRCGRVEKFQGGWPQLLAEDRPFWRSRVGQQYARVGDEEQGDRERRGSDGWLERSHTSAGMLARAWREQSHVRLVLAVQPRVDVGGRTSHLCSGPGTRLDARTRPCPAARHADREPRPGTERGS